GCESAVSGATEALGGGAALPRGEAADEVTLGVAAVMTAVGAATGRAGIARLRAMMIPTAPIPATTLTPIAAASTYLAALGVCCCAIAATIDGPVRSDFGSALPVE